MGLLVALQYLVATACWRVPFVRQMVKSQPRVVVLNGEVLTDVLRQERLTIGEVHRRCGIQVADVAGVAAVVLETQRLPQPPHRGSGRNLDAGRGAGTTDGGRVATTSSGG